MNSNRFIESLYKFREAIRKKIPQKSRNAIEMYYDNARSHLRLQQFRLLPKWSGQWPPPPLPATTKPRTRANSHLLTAVKTNLRGRHFNDTDEVEAG